MTHSIFTAEASQSYQLNRASKKELASTRQEFPLQCLSGIMFFVLKCIMYEKTRCLLLFYTLRVSNAIVFIFI